MKIINKPQLLTDQERAHLNESERFDIGSYHRFHPRRKCNFVLKMDARPLVALIDSASYGSRLYELMTIRRPGDILYYLYINFVDVDNELMEYVEERINENTFVNEELQLKGLSLYKLDNCFVWDGDDTTEFVRNWRYHREEKYWQDKLDSLLVLVRDIQKRIREETDYLLQHEIGLIDQGKHKLDYLGSVYREADLEVRVNPKTSIKESLFELISDLIKRENVQSISCPFQDYALWRVLVEEQIRRSQRTGLPPQRALTLSGPDSGLPYVEVEIGGEKRISLTKDV